MNNSKNGDISNRNNNNSFELNIENNTEINISKPITKCLPSLNEIEKTEPLFVKVLKEPNQNNVLNYLQIKELFLLSGVCQSIRAIIEKYYILRLRIEYRDIQNFEEKNITLKNIYFKEFINQIRSNWFYFNINKSIETILSLSRHTISQLRGIKKLPNLDEKIYAPLCLIFNYNSKHEKVINNGWKKTADYIISDSLFFIKIFKLKIENLEYNNINKALSYLNEIEKYIDKINRFSPYLYELNLWCKAVVIYYFLVHPYKLNESLKDKLSKENEELYQYVTFMDKLTNNFYLFKGFLEVKKISKTKLGEYIFHFEYDTKFNQFENKKIINEKEIMKLIRDDNHLIGNILSYININESILFISLNKSFYNSFLESLNISCYYLLKKLFTIKYNTFNDLHQLIPTIFENNIFSKYFGMIEDILYPQNKNISFLTKDNINYIRNYKGNNELINIICKIFCIFFNIKPEKAYDSDYSLINLYIKSVTLISIKENFLIKIIRYFNIFNLNNRQIKSFYEELSKIYDINKIKKVKNINKGFYQLLLWELYIFEYIKQFNPFLLLDKEVILNNNQNSFDDEKINIIDDYIKHLEKLKNYLKIKYHFQNLFFDKKITNSSFTQIIENVINEMKNQQIYNKDINYIIENYNSNQSNISKAYFCCKEKIFKKNKNDMPSLYQKIMEELILTNIETAKGSKGNEKINHIKKDENYYINYFTSNKNLKYYNFIENNDNNNKKVFSERIKKFNNNYKKFKYIKIDKIKKNLRYHLNLGDNSEKNKLNTSNIEDSIKKSNKKLDSNMTSKKSFFTEKNGEYQNNENEIFITKILFYLSIKDLSYFSLANKRFNKLVKIHIYIRLFFLEKKKNSIENKFSRIIGSINEKRFNYYLHNRIKPPNLRHACELLSFLRQKDIYELRKVFKNYKPQYEIIISILCVILNIAPNIYINEKGKKIFDYFSSGKKLLYDEDSISKIQKINLDDINYNIYTQLEKIIEIDTSIFENKDNYAPCLINLVKFELGVIEYFRAIRNYCISSFDYSILNQHEIEFCQKMDSSLDTYYKIKNYTFNKCQNYHSNAIKLLKKIDLNQNLGKEIIDFDDDLNSIDINYINYQNEESKME